jgi:hypothetical protein
MVIFPTETHITVVPDTATFYDGTYVQFTALLWYDDGHSRALTPSEVVYQSSNTGVAQPTSNDAIYGRVFGIAPGTATLTVHQVNKPFAAPWLVTVPLTVTSPPPPPPPPSARFSLAFGYDTHEPYPAWTPIDTHPNLVTSYSIDRGRSYELDQTDAGHATITITDPDGILDPTNPAGPYYGQIRPLLPAAVCRHNPVTDTWEQRFRGFVEDYTYEVHPSQKLNQLVVGLTDAFDVLSAAEMQPGQFGTPVQGQIQYNAGQRSDQRISQILMDTGMPRAMWAVLPGAVTLQQSIYSAGDSALNAIQEAADGEFPHVANIFCDRQGRLCFHGRNARFDPATAAAAVPGAWDYHDWKAGDGTAVNASPTDTAQVRALGFQRGLAKIFNVATALEAGAPDDAFTARRVTDSGSVTTYGIRSWSQSNLLTLHGDLDRTHPTSAATETHRFAQFIVSNYAQPQDRIAGIDFRSLDPDDPRAAANWQLLSQIDIGDTITVTVATAGGGGFSAAQYFVEGIHEDVKPLAPGYDDVTVRLDLSPRTYYSADPWATPLIAADTAPTPKTRAPLRSRRPKPAGHARDHEHDSADPVRTHYEKVGTEAGEGDGGEVDLTGYIHYGTNTGGSLEIATTDGDINLDTANVIASNSLLAHDIGAVGNVAAANVTVENTGPFATPTAIAVTGGTTGLSLTGIENGIAITPEADGQGIGVILPNGGRGLYISYGTVITGDRAIDVNIAGTHFWVDATGVYINGEEVATV